MNAINEAFERLLKSWDSLPDLPKGFKTKYYLCRYKHMNNKKLAGPAKKIEMLEAAGFIIEIKHASQIRKTPKTLTEVLTYIFHTWDNYPRKFRDENNAAYSGFIKNGSLDHMSEYRKKKIAEVCGYTQVYTKNNGIY